MLAAWMDSSFPGFTDLDDMRRAQLIEFETLLSGYLLTSQGDRMMSAHGVEGRCPFLDTGLVEMGMRMPEELRLSPGGVEKAVLKAAFGDQIPAVIRDRTKQPFRAPDALCFLGPEASAWVSDALAPDSLATSGLIDVEYATRFLAKISKSGGNGISPRDDQTFMTLMSTVMLHHQFGPDFASPPAIAVSALAVDKRSLC
jgi:asparagine synthase (glutamine-hydrolysing)